MFTEKMYRYFREKLHVNHYWELKGRESDIGLIPYFVAHLQVFSSQFKWNVWIIFWSIPVL